MTGKTAYTRFDDVSILCVEDELLIRVGLERYLHRIFGVVSSAKHGQDALKQFYETPYDIVLTDIQMPFIDGLEVIRRVKRHNPNTLVIVLSAYNENHYIEEANEAGADGYITKPFLKREFMHYLEDIGNQVLAKRASSA